jgi:hypothetical protein
MGNGAKKPRPQATQLGGHNGDTSKSKAKW